MVLTINVPDEHRKAVEDFLETIPDAVILEPALTREQQLQGLKEAVEEVNRAKQGKKQLKSAQQLLNEL
jgi:hypothetical protein